MIDMNSAATQARVLEIERVVLAHNLVVLLDPHSPEVCDCLRDTLRAASEVWVNWQDTTTAICYPEANSFGRETAHNMMCDAGSPGYYLNRGLIQWAFVVNS